MNAARTELPWSNISPVFIFPLDSQPRNVLFQSFSPDARRMPSAPTMWCINPTSTTPHRIVGRASTCTWAARTRTPHRSVSKAGVEGVLRG